MEPLSQERVERYRRRLQDLHASLAREYWKEREASREESADSVEDRIDFAVRSYTRDFLLSLSEGERKRLFLVEDALDRIERGEYGICSHCDAHIPDTRLEAVPWTRLCIVCQGLQEEGILPQWTFRARQEGWRPPASR